MGAKEDILASIFKEGVRKIRIETSRSAKLYVCVGDSYKDIEKKAKSALKRGAVVTWPDNREQWIENSPVVAESETFEMVWDEAGNKVQCEERLFTKVDGNVTHEVLRMVFVDYLKISSEF